MMPVSKVIYGKKLIARVKRTMKQKQLTCFLKKRTFTYGINVVKTTLEFMPHNKELTGMYSCVSFPCLNSHEKSTMWVGTNCGVTSGGIVISSVRAGTYNKTQLLATFSLIYLTHDPSRKQTNNLHNLTVQQQFRSRFTRV